MNNIILIVSGEFEWSVIRGVRRTLRRNRGSRESGRPQIRNLTGIPGNEIATREFAINLVAPARLPRMPEHARGAVISGKIRRLIDRKVHRSRAT